jgi:hypothetical protein
MLKKRFLEGSTCKLWAPREVANEKVGVLKEGAKVNV